MPNHVTNIIRIKANKEQIEEVLNTIQGDNFDDGKPNHFDFDKIIPMPKELLSVTNPVRIVTKKEREEQLKALKEYEKKNDRSYPPSLGLTEELQKQYLNNFGADNWYHWRIENWNTKWGAYNISLQYNELTFETAWSHPEAVINKLSTMFPKVKFAVQYADEDMGYNLGEYTIQDGSILCEDNYIEGSDEAIKFACQVKEYDYGEYLRDMEE